MKKYVTCPEVTVVTKKVVENVPTFYGKYLEVGKLYRIDSMGGYNSLNDKEPNPFCKDTASRVGDLVLCLQLCSGEKTFGLNLRSMNIYELTGPQTYTEVKDVDKITFNFPL